VVIVAALIVGGLTVIIAAPSSYFGLGIVTGGWIVSIAAAFAWWSVIRRKDSVINIILARMRDIELSQRMCKNIILDIMRHQSPQHAPSWADLECQDRTYITRVFLTRPELRLRGWPITATFTWLVVLLELAWAVGVAGKWLELFLGGDSQHGACIMCWP